MSLIVQVTKLNTEFEEKEIFADVIEFGCWLKEMETKHSHVVDLNKIQIEAFFEQVYDEYLNNITYHYFTEKLYDGEVIWKRLLGLEADLKAEGSD